MKQYVIYNENEAWIKFRLLEDNEIISSYDIEYTHFNEEIDELNKEGYTRVYDLEIIQEEMEEMEETLKSLKEKYEEYKKHPLILS